MFPQPVHGRDIYMSRINTNVSSLIAQRVLRKNNTALGLSLERLSTGLRINRLAGSTAFQGLKLLNGNFAYTTSGVTSTNFGAMQINSAQLPDNAPVDVVVSVIASAQTATIGYTGGDLSALNDVTIEIAGNKGTQQVSFAGGTTVAQIISAVNALKNSTGVSAVNSAGDVGLYSTEYGRSEEH